MRRRLAIDPTVLIFIRMTCLFDGSPWLAPPPNGLPPTFYSRRGAARNRPPVCGLEPFQTWTHAPREGENHVSVNESPSTIAATLPLPDQVVRRHGQNRQDRWRVRVATSASPEPSQKEVLCRRHTLQRRLGPNYLSLYQGLAAGPRSIATRKPMTFMGLIFGMNARSYHSRPLAFTNTKRVSIPARTGMPR